MTATQVITEIENLPPDERETVFLHFRVMEDAMIPDSFRQGMEEVARDELLDVEDTHFQHPPA